MIRLVTLAVVLAALCVSGISRAGTRVVGRDAPGLQATIDAAVPGDTVLVPEGVWSGPVVIRQTITLRGTGGVVDGGGNGTVIRVEAPDTIVEGLHVRGSGSDLGAPDSCLYVAKTAIRTVARKNNFTGCGFGVWVHEAPHVQILDNRVKGSVVGHRSDRGNGIHLFNTHHLLIRGNTISGGRDGIYVSAVEDSTFENNHFSKQRYGVHYMYSYRNTLRGNVGVDNFSGYALMGSHYIKVIGNTATGSEEYGILVRDANHCLIAKNHLEGNGVGLFIYSSVENVIRDNVMRRNEIGAKIWAGTLRNKVTGNVFAGNRRQIFYVSASDLVWGADGPGNFWSDYMGWDQDGDGIGDRPYRLDSFTTNLVHRYPQAAMLMRSPALELLSHMEQSMPLLRVPTIVDKRPRVMRAKP